jgi:Uma2 family endonuclease
MATKALLTVEDFVHAAEARDVKYELVEGELVSVSPGMLLHNRVRDRLLKALMDFLDAHALGIAVSEQPFHLFGGTVRVPDVAFMCGGRQLVFDRPIEGSPELAVEVVSPSNTPREMDERISDYFAGGAKRVWVVYPEHGEVYVHGLSGVTKRQGDRLLEDGELLPGFSIKLSTLFRTEHV